MRDSMAVQVMTMGLVTVAGLAACPNFAHAMRFARAIKRLVVDRQLPCQQTSPAERPSGGLRVVRAA